MNQGQPPPYGPYTPPPAQGGYGQQPGYGPQQGYGQQPGYPPYGGYPPQFSDAMRRNDDEQHLSILSICHFIYAGLVALGSLIGLVYVALGIMMATTAASAPSAGGPAPAAIGGVFAVIGGLFVFFFLGLAILLIVSGVSLRKRQRRTLSFVVACLICINLPLGTILGVFTLIVLNRASVKAMYDQAAFGAS